MIQTKDVDKKIVAKVFSCESEHGRCGFIVVL